MSGMFMVRATTNGGMTFAWPLADTTGEAAMEAARFHVERATGQHVVSLSAEPLGVARQIARKNLEVARTDAS